MSMLKVINYSSFIAVLFLMINLFSFARDIYPAPKSYPNHAHITIYIERNFDDFEQETIIASAFEWTEVTNHIIEYDVVQLPTKEKIDLENSVFITKISPDHPDIIIIDKSNGGGTLGFFDTQSQLPHIALVTDRLPDLDYGTVVLHELGHSLGLKHMEGLEGIDTLMFPSVDLGANHIRLEDGQQFCKLYHCDASKLKYKKESFHL